MTEPLIRDPLTGVLTRKVFEEMVKAEIEKFRRYGAKFSLLLLDLDHFKEVNDTLGHKMGDRVLVEVVERLKSLLRESDVIGRWGGDEFVVLLPYTDEKSAMRVASRITEKLKFKVQDISIGVSCAFATPKYGENVSYEKMFSLLDELLYRAKRQGRGRVGNMLDIKDKIVIPSYTFVSRDREYSLVKKAVLKENKRFVVVSGETGIGKSRLVSEFLKKEKLSFVETRSFGPVRGIPLFAIKNLFVSLYRQNRELFGEIHGALTEEEKEIVGIFIPSLSKNNFREEGYQTFFLSKLADILEKFLKGFNIVVLWVDDLQWLSRESLDVLRNFLKKKSNIRIIGTLRTEERDFFDSYIEENRISLYEIHLGRLDKKSTAQLIFGILGEDVTEETNSFVWKYSGGIPFYIEEIINFLAQKGYLKEQDGRIDMEKIPDSIPSTLEDIISYKTRGFTEDEKHVLWFVAVYHNPIEIDKLHSVLSVANSVVESAIEKALRVGILEKKHDRVFFAGEVMRRIVIKEIPRGRYIRYNRIAGELKEKDYKKAGIEPFEIYDHFKEAHDLKKQAHWAYISGEEALLRFSPDRAFYYFKEAFDSFDQMEDKKKALIGLVRSGRISGKIKDTIEILEDFGEEYLDRHLYYFYLGSMYVFAGKGDVALNLLTEAMKQSKDPEFVAECMFERAWVFRKSGRLNDCIEELERALKLDISERLKSVILSLYGGVLLEKGDIARSAKILKEVIENAERTHTEYRVSSAYINYALLQASIGRYEEAEKYYKKAIDISEKNGEKSKLLGALNNLGTLYLSIGKLREAEKCYMRALDLANETGNHSLEVIILNNLGSSAREREIYDEAVKFYKITYQKAREYGYPEWVSHAISNILITYANYYPDMDVSKEMVKELEDLLQRLDVPTEKAYASLSLIDYYRKIGDFEKAKEYIKIFKKLPRPIKEQYELNFFVSMARFYDAQNNIRMSDYYIEKIKKMADQIDNMPTKADLYFNIAEWYYEHRRLRKAKKMFNETNKLRRWLPKETERKLEKRLEELNEGG